MRYRTQLVGRDARTGRFIAVSAARAAKRKAGAVVERVKIPVRRRR